MVSARVPSHFKRSLLLVVRFNIRITHSIDRDSSTDNIDFWWWNLRERDHLEDLYLNGG
jgi:hypothetical protein